MTYVKTAARDVAIKAEYDVIVAGGGVAGAFAGISAAREGLKTLIIEQFGALGGSATIGLVTPLMSSHIKDYIGHCPLGKELTAKMRELGGTEDDEHYFDCTLMKIALENMAEKYGCGLLYYTVPIETLKSGGRITDIIVHNKDGITAFSAKYFVDATGDADLAMLAGVPCEVGNENGINQPVSLRFEMAGINYERFHEYMRKLGNNTEKYFAMNTPGMKEVLHKAFEDGILTEQDIVYFQAFGIPGKPDGMNFNCPELTTRAGVADAEFLTQKQIEGKKAIIRLRRFLTERIPGFENAYITEIAPLVGFRESRRIKARYNMTISDILSYRKFTDGIVKNCYPVDIHGVDDVTLGLKHDDVPPEERYWEVPFSCMIPCGVDNLLVAGRCGGFDFRAQSATRIQLVCRAMGEAAGIGCALAVKDGLPFDKVNGAAVRKRMEL